MINYKSTYSPGICVINVHFAVWFYQIRIILFNCQMFFSMTRTERSMSALGCLRIKWIWRSFVQLTTADKINAWILAVGVQGKHGCFKGVWRALRRVCYFYKQFSDWKFHYTHRLFTGWQVLYFKTNGDDALPSSSDKLAFLKAADFTIDLGKGTSIYSRCLWLKYILNVGEFFIVVVTKFFSINRLSFQALSFND